VKTTPPLLLLALSLGVAAARVEQTRDLRRLFPRERDVFIERDGLTRIALPPDVLAACRPDLADLRVFDQKEREVPYLIDAGPPPGTAVDVVRTAKVVVGDVRRDEVHREDGPPLYRETYVIGPPPADGAVWELVFDVSRLRFVRRLDVAPADGGAPIVSAGSLFRLPDVPAEKLRAPLPSPAPKSIVLTLEGEDGGYVEPRLHFETARTVAAPHERVVVPLEETARRRQEGRTVIEVARPRGVVPDVLRLETTTGSFNRNVEVWDEGAGRTPALLGREKLFRVEAAVPVEARELAVQAAHGDSLRVEIEDGDSGPLDGIALAAVIREPVLIVSLHGTGDSPEGRLRYGGGRAHVPHYDLAGLLPAPGTPLVSARATAAARLYDAAEVRPARLGEPRDNPAYDGSPALAFAMRPGATLDARAWTHRRPIAVHPSAEGLARLRLSAADLARARPDLADVRIIDGESRQWPYLLGHEPAHAWVDLEIVGPTRRRSTSVYELRLPVTPVTADLLSLESEAPFFDRAAAVTGRQADDTEVGLAAGRLVLLGEQQRPITLGLRPDRITSLELLIEDGNDAPLRFRAARAHLVERDLYLAAPTGDYALLVGNTDATTPSYELERVRDVVLAVTSGTAEAAELGSNPDYSLRARLASGEQLEGTLPKVVLWVVLLGAVIVLTLVTLRLARREESEDGEG
jgi:hypothetical protein